MTENAKILIVDDDPDIRNVLTLLLENHGCITLAAAGGPEALELIAARPDIDLIILDIMMPGMDGIEVCENIRKTCNAPILFLTARTGENDRLEAYASGGDDFLEKPFSQALLLAKVTSLLRRYTEYRGKPEQCLAAAGITLDTSSHAAYRSGAALDLTDKEYNILEYLIVHRGSVVSVQELYENVWEEKYLPSSTNTVMVHILNLRKKIETDASNPKIIRTVWGKGYQVDKEN